MNTFTRLVRQPLIRPGTRLTPFLTTRFPNIRTRTYVQNTTDDRLSVEELQEKLSEKRDAPVIVDICTNNEQSQGGERTSSYAISVNDFNAALEKQQTSNETYMPRFQYSKSGSKHYVEVYLESSRSTCLASEITKRGKDIQDKEDPDGGLKGEGLEWGASNKAASEGTGSSQPLNL
ncbi:hypothetical protein HDV00_010270 [Rhizophlyctis rosea]|nr:hypothetical protein HDV00_010270 [Rhizophlyctis rosea]